jgi:hypothetical protein
VVEDFPGNYSDLELMKTVQRLHKRRKQSRKKDWKQPDWKFDFQRAKEYQKIEKKSRILFKKLHRAIVHGRKVPDKIFQKSKRTRKHQ